MPLKTASRSRLKLDRTVVVDAALQVADAEGLDAVTIRRLAQDLSVTPMALYWHFKDKDALLAGVADRLWDDTAMELQRMIAALDPSGDAEGGWARLRLTLDALVLVMRRHPAVAALAPSRVVECDAGLAITEQTLAFLAERGFDRPRAAEIARFVLCSAVMLVDSEPGAGIPELVERQEAVRLKRIALASLPVGRYPNIAASAEYLTDCDVPDSYYSRAVDMVMAGVRNEVAAPSPTR